MKNVIFSALIYTGALSAAVAAPAASRVQQDLMGDTNPVISSAREQAMLDRLCADKTNASQRDQDITAILSKALLLSDAQKNDLKNFQAAQDKANSDARDKLCNNKPDLASFEGNLSFRQKMLEDQLDRIKAVNPKLLAFYNGLNGEQKAKFDQMRGHMDQMREMRRR